MIVFYLGLVENSIRKERKDHVFLSYYYYRIIIHNVYL